MKRWIPIGVVLVLVILAFGLCATAWNPGEFSGDWYCAETGELFRFQDGLVSCEQHNLLTGTIDAMCGAYCFDRDSVTVFSLGVAGLENPRQLYLIHGTACAGRKTVPEKHIFTAVSKRRWKINESPLPVYCGQRGFFQLNGYSEKGFIFSSMG